MARTVGVFDGVSTSVYGVKLVNINNGIQEDAFLPQQELVTDDSFYNERPYFYKSRKSQLEIRLRFFREGFWDNELKKEIVNMIDPEHDNFVEFFTEENPDRRYFVKYIGESNFNNAGNQGGYFDVRFRTDSPYAYSKEYSLDLDISNGSLNYKFYNDGNLSMNPLMWIEMNSSDDVEIENKTTGESFTMKSLEQEEEIYVNNENGDIESSLEINNVYRYDNHNGTYLKLVPGINDLEISGDCKIKMIYRFKYKG